MPIARPVADGATATGESMLIEGTEREMGDDDIIVSKTNLKGHLTYTNDAFLDIADFTATQVLGKPHSILRNPAMPRCIFKLLWDTIQSGREVFAYIVNRTRGGDYYWVLAH
ncbi:MAG: PAS domain-containing protein, partial [Burkholderiales bacterium]|nr:PAS domain-containing protein [Burkholderiales bacterium]